MRLPDSVMPVAPLKPPPAWGGDVMVDCLCFVPHPLPEHQVFTNLSKTSTSPLFTASASPTRLRNNQRSVPYESRAKTRPVGHVGIWGIHHDSLLTRKYQLSKTPVLTVKRELPWAKEFNLPVASERIHRYSGLVSEVKIWERTLHLVAYISGGLAVSESPESCPHASKSVDACPFS